MILEKIVGDGVHSLKKEGDAVVFRPHPTTPLGDGYILNELTLRWACRLPDIINQSAHL